MSSRLRVAPRCADPRCSQIAVCSTSNEASVSGIVRVGLGADVAKVMRVFAGDVVPRKKPDPAIYLLAAKELGVEPGRCVVVEDSHIGVRAAKAAGMRCMVTTSGCACAAVVRPKHAAAAADTNRQALSSPTLPRYTGDEDFSLADAVFDCIGDKGALLRLAGGCAVTLMPACSIQVRNASRCTT